MFCIECGSSMDAKAKFCSNCGTNVDVTAFENANDVNRDESHLSDHHANVISNTLTNTTIFIIGVIVIAVWLGIKTYSGNGFFSKDEEAVQRAEQILKEILKAPDTYSRKAGEVLWSGKDKEGNPAFFVNLKYTSQNVFGATLSDCRTVAFKVIGDQLSFNSDGAINVCLDERGDKHDPEYLKEELERNDLDYYSK